jgi:hypothetical protein
MLHNLNAPRSQERLVAIDKNDPRAVAQARALIALLYKVDSSNRKAPLYRARNNKRFRELETVIAFNHRGMVLSDDDAGRADLHVVACHLLRMNRKSPINSIRAWAEQRAPWCSLQELELIMQRAAADTRCWSADELAEELGLTFELRMALGVTTIGAIDYDKAKREGRRAANSQKRSEGRRRKQGAKPRAEYEAKSAARSKPWRALGISESTYYRRKRKSAQCDDSSPNAAIRGDTLVCSHFCHQDAPPLRAAR